MPEQALGGVSLGFGFVVEDKLDYKCLDGLYTKFVYNIMCKSTNLTTIYTLSSQSFPLIKHCTMSKIIVPPNEEYNYHR